MRVLGKIFSGICATLFMCSMQAAPAKSSTAKKSSKPKLELEIKGISEAKKLYKFLESNEGKIVEISVRLPYFDTERIYFYRTTNEKAKQFDGNMCKRVKEKFNGGYFQDGTTILEDDMVDECGTYTKDTIVHHIGTNILSEKLGKNKTEMDDKWKKANNDIVVAGIGYFDAAAEDEIAGYVLDESYIAFEDYQGGGKNEIYSIVTNGIVNSCGYNICENGLNGFYLVRHNHNSDYYATAHLDSSDITYCGDVGDGGAEEECEATNTQSLYLEPIDIPKYKAIFEYLGK